MLNQSDLKPNMVIERVNIDKMRIEHFVLVERIFVENDIIGPHYDWEVKLGTMTTWFMEDEILRYFDKPYSNHNIKYSCWEIKK